MQYSYNPNSQHASETCRDSPTSHSMEQAPLLPPIHHLDGQQQAQYTPASMNGAPTSYQQQPLAYPPPQTVPYQNGGLPQSMASNGNANEQLGMMRFPIPPQPTLMDSRQMSGGRHKKEIKRRTKTGCLTCRKRRIKCDEGHPACKNCQKSKRECLGYDPIFKQQPAPTPIQPAPNSAAALCKQPTITPLHHSFPAAPQGYAPVSSGGYAQHPYQGSGFDPSSEYSSAIDPALAGADPASLPMSQQNYATPLQSERNVTPINMDQLYSLSNIPPSFVKHETPRKLEDQQLQAVKDFYTFHYAQGLDKLFETTWYSSDGTNHLLHGDPQLLNFVFQCTQQFKAAEKDPLQKSLPSLDARLVWQLASMPHSAAAQNGSSSSLSAVKPRVDVVEKILTGHYLEASRIPPPPSASQGNQPNQNAIYNEQSFWHNLGKLVSLRDDEPSSTTTKEVADTLAAMRSILGMLESRDVHYSLAIARHIGGRMPQFHPDQPLKATTSDQEDDLNRLIVAHRFLDAESTRGTTQVIQRVCGMFIRGWQLQKQS